VLDATLTLDGRVDDMRLGGQVTVRDALYSRPFPSNLFQFIGGDSEPSLPSNGPSLPLTYDGIQITAASSVRVQNSGDFSARLTASADLELQGTYDRPGVVGDMEIEPGGEVTFLGKRYTITQGVVYFNNPMRIEPTIDIEAETRVRVPGETYRITANVRGICCDRLEAPAFTSDPSLAQVDILALLFTDVAPDRDVELRRFRADGGTQQRALSEFATQAAAGPVSSQVSRALEQAFGVDRVQITPSFLDRNQASARLEPSVRLRLEERLSERLFLTYSRSLSSSSPDEIIMLEFDYTDQITWVFSRNEDQTYALEVRMRHAF
jgi:translocation and assembly module TamB